MTRINSFYLAPDFWPDNGRATLLGSEAHHLVRVLRHQPGDTVRLFDGCGLEGIFTVIRTGKKEVELEQNSSKTHPAPSSPLTLALGWNRSSRREWLLEKSVELGSGALLFWQASHSQGRIPLKPKDKWKDKLIQAAKQCANPWLPALSCASGIDELLTLGSGFEQKLLLWESSQATTLLAPEMLAQGKTIAVIGPEGGLDKAEAKALIAGGFMPVTLGSSILRWETAALHCLSLSFFARQPG